MTLPRVFDLFAYWNTKQPPTNELVAAFVGFKAKNEKSTPMSDAEMEAFLATLPQSPPQGNR